MGRCREKHLCHAALRAPQQPGCAHTHFSGVAIKRLQIWLSHFLTVNSFNSLLLLLCNFCICISLYFCYTCYETWADCFRKETNNQQNKPCIFLKGL